MPIYAYRCADCGHTKDVLRKLADPPLTRCPGCGAEAFTKQLTAAGFQLKGSGWYATDFKGGGAKPAAEPANGAAPSKDDGATKPASDGAAGPVPAASAPASEGGSGGAAAPAATPPAAAEASSRRTDRA